jgi:hypothetical protein
VLSPYLWCFSNHYTKGKYVSDGRWSETAVSQQCGAAVLLRRMAEKGIIQLGDNIAAEIPLTTPDISFKKAKTKYDKPLIKFSMKKIKYVTELQAFLNQMPGIFLKEDSVPGEKTSGAVKEVFGFYLDGDPRDDS